MKVETKRFDIPENDFEFDSGTCQVVISASKLALSLAVKVVVTLVLSQECNESVNVSERGIL